MNAKSTSVEHRIPEWLIDPRMMANLYRLMFALFIAAAVLGITIAFLSMQKMQEAGGLQSAADLGRLLFLFVLFCLAFCAILFFSAPSKSFLKAHQPEDKNMLRGPKGAPMGLEQKKIKYDPATNIDNWEILSSNPKERSRISVAEDGLNYMRSRRKRLDDHLEMKSRADMMRRFRAD